MVPVDNLITDSEEVPEPGKNQISPRSLQEAIHALTCVPGLESAEAENLAQELLVLANHPLVGEWKTNVE